MSAPTCIRAPDGSIHCGAIVEGEQLHLGASPAPGGEDTIAIAPSPMCGPVAIEAEPDLPLSDDGLVPPPRVADADAPALFGLVVNGLAEEHSD